MTEIRSPYSPGRVGALSILLFAISSALIPATSLGATHTWNNPAGGVWSVASNWAPPEVPNSPGQSVLLPDLGSPYEVYMSGDSPHIETMTIESGVTLFMRTGTTHLLSPAGLVNRGRITALASQFYGNVWNQAGALIEVNEHWVEMQGNVVNDGTIKIGPSLGNRMIFLGDVEISGSGDLVLGPEGSILSTGTITNGASHTIRGTGGIGAQLDNYGSVIADVPTEHWLSLGSQPRNFGGTLLATNGGKLSVGALVNDGGVIEADGGTILGSPVNANGVIHAHANGMSLVGSINNIGGTILADGEVLLSGSITGGTLAGPSLYRSAGVTLADVTVDAGTEVRLEGASVLRGPKLVNHGTVRVQANLRVATPVEFQGSGTLRLASGALTPDAGVGLVNAAGHSIRGNGGISGPMVNHGLIEAADTGLNLVIQSAAWTNHGVARAVNGGYLKLTGGALTNSADLAASGGEVWIQSGATVTNTGAGRIVADGGNVMLAGSTACTLQGGTLEIGAPGLFINTKVTSLDGVTLAAGAELITPADATTTVFGTTQSRDGTLRVLGTLRCAGPLTLLGNGDVTLEGGTLDAPAVHITDGGLGGVGIVTGDVTNAARVSPGGSPGMLHLQGDYIQTADGRLEIELGGVAAGQFDVLAIDGAATLDGTIAAALFGAYDPAVGEEFVVMTFASRSGDFSTFENFDLGGGPEVLLHDYPAPGGALRLRVVPEVYTGVGDPRLPERVRLYGFTTRGGAALALELPTPREVSIGLYDAAGRRVATLERGGARAAGRHVLPLEAEALRSGVYFARAVLGSGAQREVHRSRVVVAN